MRDVFAVLSAGEREINQARVSCTTATRKTPPQVKSFLAGSRIAKLGFLLGLATSRMMKNDKMLGELTA